MQIIIGPCSTLSLCCRWTLLCQMTNWFNAYCLVRTYSNSLEALCTVMGVFYWLTHRSAHLHQPRNTPDSSQQHQVQDTQPLHHAVCQQHGQLKVPCSPVKTPTPSVQVAEENSLLASRQKALWAAALGVLLRPSSVLFWVPLGESLSLLTDLSVTRSNLRYTCCPCCLEHTHEEWCQ